MLIPSSAKSPVDEAPALNTYSAADSVEAVMTKSPSISLRYCFARKNPETKESGIDLCSPI